MVEPESSWLEHPIKKIYGTYFNYAVARQKLKQAEELSDLTSNTEKEEFLKKSRKLRAAKIIDTSISSNEELTDESNISELPKIPITTSVAKPKITKNTQKDINYRNKKKEEKNSIAYNRSIIKAKKEDNTHVQHITGVNKRISLHAQPAHWLEDDGDMTILKNLSNLTSNRDLQSTSSTSLPYYTEEWLEDDGDDGNDVTMQNNLTNLISNKDVRCIASIPNIYEWLENDDNNVTNLTSNINVQCTANVPPNTQEWLEDDNNVTMQKNFTNLTSNGDSQNFQRYVIRKLIDLESKLNCIKKSQKLILEKLSIGIFQTEEQEKIDIFQDLPLKNENDLEVMETKLKNDLFYRNQMIKQLSLVTCRNMKTSCLQIMKVIFANKLAMSYSWYGAKKKRTFSKLNIYKIILSVIRKSHGDEITDEQISAPIKIWLAHAKEREDRGQKSIEN